MEKTNKKRLKFKFNKKSFILIGVLLLVVAAIIGYTATVVLENDVQVQQRSDLTYYLEVTYDGVDVLGVQSNDATVANIKSGYIYVEDKIPEGLIFNGFVETEDGTIGAVSRSDGTTCLGYVVDDSDPNAETTINEYHGLHYDPDTRIVSFKVKNLQAGCKLTVGIKTVTPSIDDPNTEEIETRRDFYNSATAKEDFQTATSNTVHVWMGEESPTTYEVSYEYSGDVPDNAPTLPTTKAYTEGASVGVENEPNVDGYEFSGWTTTDATVTSGSFKMPGKKVTFTGSFTEIPGYTVTYQIDGDSPDNYVLPTTKEYYKDNTVKLDALQPGDIINGYRFLGWTTTDVTVSSDNDFTMPESNVVITGQFEEVTYNVSYEFTGSVIPENSETLLPETKAYKPGETVTLETISDVEGYKFLGWYKEDNFTMPEEDVVIYGEWQLQTGTFEPQVTMEVVDQKMYYPGDTVLFKITVTNPEAYAIESVMLKENKEEAYLVAFDKYNTDATATATYTLLTNHIAEITSIPAGGSVVVYAEYTVTSDDVGTITNEVEVTGATAANNYNFNTEKEYKATATFDVVSKLKICNTVSGNPNNTNTIFQYNVNNASYDTWVTLSNDGCYTLYLEPGTYNVNQLIPQEYSISSVTGAITSNNTTFDVVLGNNYEINYTNAYAKKGYFHTFGRVINIIKGIM